MGGILFIQRVDQRHGARVSHVTSLHGSLRCPSRVHIRVRFPIPQWDDSAETFDLRFHLILFKLVPRPTWVPAVGWDS